MGPSKESMKQELDHALTNHTPSAEDIKKIEALREASKALGSAIIDNCPQVMEQAYALHYLEIVTMFAVASIARNSE